IVERSLVDSGGNLGAFAALSTSLVTGRFEVNALVAGNHLWILGGRDVSGTVLMSTEQASLQ
ncbi:MAG: hypothetical protein KGR26_10045, partial [Cyanobacteria bacterium REEB65]|nr:hypothetical protein [Cyanobacteria bacterium REEB65]